MTKLVYIGGYGRSGSTLLEYLMSANPEFVACGEVARAARDRTMKKNCTCSARVEDCPLWGEFLTSDRRRHEDLTLALLQRVGPTHAAMIDSSKTAWRHVLAPFRLRGKLGVDFLLIHLVRDPRGVCWSAIKKPGGRKMPVNEPVLCCTTALGWSIDNLACELFGRLYPEQYMRLRYEDFVASPRATLDRLLQRMVPGTKWHAETLSMTENRHQLYGNRMRGKPLTLADVKEDRAWQTDMPASYRRLVSPLSFILRARYNYP